MQRTYAFLPRHSAYWLRSRLAEPVRTLKSLATRRKHCPSICCARHGIVITRSTAS